MWGSVAVVWAICLACFQPAVCPWILPFRSNKDRPRPAHGALTEKVECFSDYMTLKIPRSHVQGLRQWLAGVLRLPGTKRAPNHLDSLLTKCGYLLHPAHEGDFVFRALYSGCFVQKEKANYRLEIRMFHRRAKRLKQSDHYIMKCPMVTPRLGEQSVRCHPSFIQVSRPWPPQGSDSGQTPWLLSLRGELVASLEDASLIGLEVDIGTTTATIQSPRQELLQRQEVWNTSLELLPLWLVSGSYAYSFEAACPLVSSQPGSEISVHIPKQRLGLVKRGSLIEESLSPRFLEVQQFDTFTVAEDRDFVVVSIPASQLLQDQPCQEARESPGTQAFYRVDLRLDFAEMVTPVHWTVENFFQCVDSCGTDTDFEREGWNSTRPVCRSREELLVSTATPRTTLPALSPGPQTTQEETPSTASSQPQTPPVAALGEPPEHQPAKEPTKQELAAPFMGITRPAGEGRVSMPSPSSRARQEHHGPQSPPGKADFSPHPQTPATLSSDHTEVSQAGPGPSHLVFLTPGSLSKHLSPAIPSSPRPSWPSDGPQVLPSSEPSATLAEVSRTVRDEQDSVQPPGSPFPPGNLSSETVNSTESMGSIPQEPAHISEDFLLLTRPFMSSLAEEGLIFHHDPKRPQERPIIEAGEPLQNDHDPSGEETRGYPDLPTSEPSQERKGLGTDATLDTSRRRQPDARAYLGTSSPEPTERLREGSAALQTTLPKGLLASTFEKPAAPPEGGADRILELQSAPSWPEGWHDLGTAHTASPLPSHTQNLLAPTEVIFPPSGEPGNTLPSGQESVESRLDPVADSHQPPELEYM